MKTHVINKVLLLFFLMSGGIAMYGQSNQAEVPGDHFSLEGALELFKKSASPEEFEQLLNSEDSKVNNLDLNGDGFIDYIRVIDRNEGNVHAFILQAVISEKESQDVAVIELEKLSNGKAVLQITGDEDIYGVETIIEPTTEVRTYAGTTTTRTVVNVWAWPSVQYIYSPHYTSVWVSPWRWSVRPVWYRPWRPVDYYVYSPYWHSYRPYYSSCHTHRIVYARHLYQPYRTTSVIVYNRHHKQIDHYRTTGRNYQRSSSGREYSGRDRNDYHHSNGRQSNNSYHPDTNGRTRSTTYTHNERNSRSTDMNRSSYQKKSESTPESQSSRSGFSSGNKFSSDARNMPGVTQRQSDGQSRRDYSNRKSTVSDFNGSSQISKPKVDTRGSQPSLQTNRSSSNIRSSSPATRTHSSGSSSHQRSGNDGGGSKSGGHSRGKH